MRFTRCDAASFSATRFVLKTPCADAWGLCAMLANEALGGVAIHLPIRVLHVNGFALLSYPGQLPEGVQLSLDFVEDGSVERFRLSTQEVLNTLPAACQTASVTLRKQLRALGVPPAAADTGLVFVGCSGQLQSLLHPAVVRLANGCTDSAIGIDGMLCAADVQRSSAVLAGALDSGSVCLSGGGAQLNALRSAQGLPTKALGAVYAACHSLHGKNLVLREMLSLLLARKVQGVQSAAVDACIAQARASDQDTAQDVLLKAGAVPVAGHPGAVIFPKLVEQAAAVVPSMSLRRAAAGKPSCEEEALDTFLRRAAHESWALLDVALGNGEEDVPDCAAALRTRVRALDAPLGALTEEQWQWISSTLQALPVVQESNAKLQAAAGSVPLVGDIVKQAVHPEDGLVVAPPTRAPAGIFHSLVQIVVHMAHTVAFGPMKDPEAWLATARPVPGALTVPIDGWSAEESGAWFATVGDFVYSRCPTLHAWRAAKSFAKAASVQAEFATITLLNSVFSNSRQLSLRIDSRADEATWHLPEGSLPRVISLDSAHWWTDMLPAELRLDFGVELGRTTGGHADKAAARCAPGDDLRKCGLNGLELVMYTLREKLGLQFNSDSPWEGQALCGVGHAAASDALSSIESDCATAVSSTLDTLAAHHAESCSLDTVPLPASFAWADAHPLPVPTLARLVVQEHAIGKWDPTVDVIEPVSQNELLEAMLRNRAEHRHLLHGLSMKAIAPEIDHATSTALVAHLQTMPGLYVMNSSLYNLACFGLGAVVLCPETILSAASPPNMKSSSFGLIAALTNVAAYSILQPKQMVRIRGLSLISQCASFALAEGLRSVIDSSACSECGSGDRVFAKEYLLSAAPTPGRGLPLSYILQVAHEAATCDLPESCIPYDKALPQAAALARQPFTAPFKSSLIQQQDVTLHNFSTLYGGRHAAPLSAATYGPLPGASDAWCHPEQVGGLSTFRKHILALQQLPSSLPFLRPGATVGSALDFCFQNVAGRVLVDLATPAAVRLSKQLQLVQRHVVDELGDSPGQLPSGYRDASATGALAELTADPRNGVLFGGIKVSKRSSAQSQVPIAKVYLQPGSKRLSDGTVCWSVERFTESAAQSALVAADSAHFLPLVGMTADLYASQHRWKDAIIAAISVVQQIPKKVQHSAYYASAVMNIGDLMVASGGLQWTEHGVRKALIKHPRWASPRAQPQASGGDSKLTNNEVFDQLQGLLLGDPEGTLESLKSASARSEAALGEALEQWHIAKSADNTQAVDSALQPMDCAGFQAGFVASVRSMAAVKPLLTAQLDAAAAVRAAATTTPAGDTASANSMYLQPQGPSDLAFSTMDRLSAALSEMGCTPPALAHELPVDFATCTTSYRLKQHPPSVQEGLSFPCDTIFDGLVLFGAQLSVFERQAAATADAAQGMMHLAEASLEQVKSLQAGQAAASAVTDAGVAAQHALDVAGSYKQSSSTPRLSASARFSATMKLSAKLNSQRAAQDALQCYLHAFEVLLSSGHTFSSPLVASALLRLAKVVPASYTADTAYFKLMTCLDALRAARAAFGRLSPQTLPALTLGVQVMGELVSPDCSADLSTHAWKLMHSTLSKTQLFPEQEHSSGQDAMHFAARALLEWAEQIAETLPLVDSAREAAAVASGSQSKTQIMLQAAGMSRSDAASLAGSDQLADLLSQARAVVGRLQPARETAAVGAGSSSRSCPVFSVVKRTQPADMFYMPIAQWDGLKQIIRPAPTDGLHIEANIAFSHIDEVEYRAAGQAAVLAPSWQPGYCSLLSSQLWQAKAVLSRDSNSGLAAAVKAMSFDCQLQVQGASDELLAAAIAELIAVPGDMDAAHLKLQQHTREDFPALLHQFNSIVGLEESKDDSKGAAEHREHLARSVQFMINAYGGEATAGLLAFDAESELKEAGDLNRMQAHALQLHGSRLSAYTVHHFGGRGAARTHLALARSVMRASVDMLRQQTHLWACVESIQGVMAGTEYQQLAQRADGSVPSPADQLLFVRSKLKFEDVRLAAAQLLLLNSMWDLAASLVASAEAWFADGSNRNALDVCSATSAGLAECLALGTAVATAKTFSVHCMVPSAEEEGSLATFLAFPAHSPGSDGHHPAHSAYASLLQARAAHASRHFQQALLCIAGNPYVLTDDSHQLSRDAIKQLKQPLIASLHAFMGGMLQRVHADHLSWQHLKLHDAFALVRDQEASQFSPENIPLVSAAMSIVSMLLPASAGHSSNFLGNIPGVSVAQDQEGAGTALTGDQEVAEVLHEAAEAQQGACRIPFSSSAQWSSLPTALFEEAAAMSQFPQAVHVALQLCFSPTQALFSIMTLGVASEMEPLSSIFWPEALATHHTDSIKAISQLLQEPGKVELAWRSVISSSTIQSRAMPGCLVLSSLARAMECSASVDTSVCLEAASASHFAYILAGQAKRTFQNWDYLPPATRNLFRRYSPLAAPAHRLLCCPESGMRALHLAAIAELDGFKPLSANERAVAAFPTIPLRIDMPLLADSAADLEHSVKLAFGVWPDSQSSIKIAAEVAAELIYEDFVGSGVDLKLFVSEMQVVMTTKLLNVPTTPARAAVLAQVLSGCMVSGQSLSAVETGNGTMLELKTINWTTHRTMHGLVKNMCACALHTRIVRLLAVRAATANGIVNDATGGTSANAQGSTQTMQRVAHEAIKLIAPVSMNLASYLCDPLGGFAAYYKELSSCAADAMGLPAERSERIVLAETMNSEFGLLCGDPGPCSITEMNSHILFEVGLPLPGAPAQAKILCHYLLHVRNPVMEFSVVLVPTVAVLCGPFQDAHRYQKLWQAVLCAPELQDLTNGKGVQIVMKELQPGMHAIGFQQTCGLPQTRGARITAKNLCFSIHGAIAAILHKIFAIPPTNPSTEHTPACIQNVPNSPEGIHALMPQVERQASEPAAAVASPESLLPELQHSASAWLEATHKVWVLVRALNFLKADSPQRTALRGAAASLQVPLPAALSAYKIPLARLFDAMKPLLEGEAGRHRAFVSSALIERVFIVGEILGVPEWCGWALSCVAAGIAVCDTPKPLHREAVDWLHEYAVAHDGLGQHGQLPLFVSSSSDGLVRSLGFSEGHPALLTSLAGATSAEAVTSELQLRAGDLRSVAESCLGLPWLDWVEAAAVEYNSTARAITRDPLAQLGDESIAPIASTTAPLATLLLPEVLNELCVILSCESETRSTARNVLACGGSTLLSVLVTAFGVPLGAAGLMHKVPCITRSQAFARVGLQVPNRTGGKPSSMADLMQGGHSFEPTSVYEQAVQVLSDNPIMRVMCSLWVQRMSAGILQAVSGGPPALAGLLEEDMQACLELGRCTSACSVSALAAAKNVLSNELVEVPAMFTSAGLLRFDFIASLRACMLAEAVNQLSAMVRNESALMAFAMEHLGPEISPVAAQMASAALAMWSEPITPVNALYGPALSAADLPLLMLTGGPILQHTAQPTPGVVGAFDSAWCSVPASELSSSETARMNAELRYPAALRATYLSAISELSATEQAQSLGSNLPAVLLSWAAADRGVLPAIQAPIKAGIDAIIEAVTNAVGAASVCKQRVGAMHVLSLIAAASPRQWYATLTSQGPSDHGRFAACLAQCISSGDSQTAEGILQLPSATSLFGGVGMLLLTLRAAQGASEITSRDIASLDSAVSAAMCYLTEGKPAGLHKLITSSLADMSNSMTLAMTMSSLIGLSASPNMQASLGQPAVAACVVQQARKVWGLFTGAADSQHKHATHAAAPLPAGAMQVWLDSTKVQLPAESYIHEIDMDAQLERQPRDVQFVEAQLSKLVKDLHSSGLEASKALLATVHDMCKPSTSTGCSAEFECALSSVAEQAHALAFAAPFSQLIADEWFQQKWLQRIIHVASACEPEVGNTILMGATRSLSTLLHGFEAPGVCSQVRWASALAAAVGGHVPAAQTQHDHATDGAACSHTESYAFQWLHDTLHAHGVDRTAQRGELARAYVHHWNAWMRFAGWRVGSASTQVSFASSLLFAPCSDAMLQVTATHVLDAGGLGPLLSLHLCPSHLRDPQLLALCTLVPYLMSEAVPDCPVLDTHSYTSVHGGQLLLFSKECFGAPSQQEQADGGVLVSRATALALCQLLLFPIVCGQVQSSACSATVSQASIILAALHAPDLPAPMLQVLRRVQYSAADLSALPVRVHEMLDDCAESQGYLAELIAAAQQGKPATPPSRNPSIHLSDLGVSCKLMAAWRADAAGPPRDGAWLRSGQDKPSDGDALQWLPPPPMDAFSPEARTWVWQFGVRAERAVVALPFGVSQAAASCQTFLALEAFFPLAAARLALHPLFLDSMYTAGTIGSLLQVAEGVGSTLHMDEQGHASDMGNRMVALGWLDTLCNRAVLAGQSISLLAHASGPAAAQGYLESAQAAAQQESEGALGNSMPHGGLPILVQALDPILEAAKSAAAQPRAGGWFSSA